MITTLYKESIIAMSSLFDWSSVDREILAQMVRFSEPSIVGKSLQPIEFAKKLRTIFRLFEVPINVRCIYHKQTAPSAVWVGGMYRADQDICSNNYITIITQFNNRNSPVKINKLMFRRLCSNIADTILHEVIHTRQYRRRNYKDIPGYTSTAQSGKKRVEQTYLGHPDEIDAYSFNIACQLSDKFNADRKKIIKYLDTDLNDRRIKKDSYKMYLEAFDFNYKHTVIKKLKKKVVNYLPNAIELGKPYKTSDWLKK